MQPVCLVIHAAERLVNGRAITRAASALCSRAKNNARDGAKKWRAETFARHDVEFMHRRAADGRIRGAVDLNFS